MDIVDNLKLSLLDLGARPVLWLLLVLSVVSFAVVLERSAVFLWLRDDLDALRRELVSLLRARDLAGARARLTRSRAPEARVVLVGLTEADGGIDAVQQAMVGEVAAQRKRLERRLSFLGSVGSNAPFVGLLGTVVGIMEAFEQLGQSTAGPAASSTSAAVMAGIAEALVATAVGLAVAIPAVVAFNVFQRTIKSRLADIEMLSSALLAHLCRIEANATRALQEVS